MWQAEIIEVRKSITGLEIIVEYSNNTQKFSESINTAIAQSDTWLKEAILNRLDQLNGLDSYAATIQLGVVKP